MRGAVLLALIGVLLAAVLGYAAHVVAQDTIALPAVSLDSRRPLAPDAARPRAEPRVETQPQPEVEPTRTDNSGSGSSNSGSGSSSSGPGSGESEDEDSGQGRGRGRGRGGDD